MPSLAESLFPGFQPARGEGSHIVHPDRDDAQGTGDQLSGPAAFQAVAGHVGHLPLAPLRQPGQETCLVVGEVEVGDPQALETQVLGPDFDVLGELDQVVRTQQGRGAALVGVVIGVHCSTMAGKTVGAHS